MQAVEDWTIYNRYHDRYDNRNNDRQHDNTNRYYEEGFDNRVNSHQYEQSPDNTNLTIVNMKLLRIALGLD